MVEAEGHVELLFHWIRVADAAGQGGGVHLPHGEHIADVRVGGHLLQIFVDVGAVGIEAAPIADIIVLEDGGLGDQVYHIEPEALDALCLPETQDVFYLLPYGRIIPVQIRLALVKEMKVPLAHLRRVGPRAAAELGLPVGGRRVRRALPEDVVRHLRDGGVAGGGAHARAGPVQLHGFGKKYRAGA